MKTILFILLLLISGFTSFAQQEDENLTPLQKRIEKEMQQIQKTTNWSDEEESRKATIKIGELMQQYDRAEGIESDTFPIDTTRQPKTVIGAEMAEQVSKEIIGYIEKEDEIGEVSDEYYQEATFLMIDMENPKPGLSLPDVKKFSNIEVLFVKGTKAGVEINLDSLFVYLEGKPLTELYLVRNYSGTKTIPESIGKLSKLKKLGLYANEINALPAAIQNLSNLEVLYVDLNPISSLPSGISTLRNLKMLGIAKTGIDKEEQSRIQKLVPNCKILIK